MALVSIPPADFKRLPRKRRSSGGDRLDEVWNGVYVMSPPADNEHQALSGILASIFLQVLGHNEDVKIFPGCNLSDRSDDWTQNYRCPDVAVFLPGNPAEDRGTHWLGGPDFAVEILSPYDRARKKFDFHAKVGVRELLFVCRRPWSLELYRPAGQGWNLVGKSLPTPDSLLLASEVLPLKFRLIPGERRPRIEVVGRQEDQHWLA